MNEWIIQTQNLTRDFTTGPAGETVRAVDGLTLEVPRGIVFGFLGPNGSGKTTTIRLLLGLLEPTGGRAQVFGLDTIRQSAAIRERTGALLEHTGLYERLSAEDNLEFYGRIAHMPALERRTRIRELLDQMGLWERRKETVGNWSRGMKQKLAIARALMHRPELIFLDEPTAGLDPVAGASLRDDLAGLAGAGKTTIFLTTHNLTEAERLCEQVAVIRAGKLLATGKPETLRSRSRTQQVEIHGQGITPALIAQVLAMPVVNALRPQNSHFLLETSPGAPLAPIIQTLVTGGAQVEEVRKNRASLEEIFFDLVEDEQQETVL
jgi:ABC-2 type transport system ATP-binding protein